MNRFYNLYNGIKPEPQSPTADRERADCLVKIFEIMCRDIGASFAIDSETARLLEKYHPELPINYIGDDGRLKPGLNAKRLM